MNREELLFDHVWTQFEQYGYKFAKSPNIRTKQKLQLEELLKDALKVQACELLDEMSVDDWMFLFSDYAWYDEFDEIFETKNKIRIAF